MSLRRKNRGTRCIHVRLCEIKVVSRQLARRSGGGRLGRHLTTDYLAPLFSLIANIHINCFCFSSYVGIFSKNLLSLAHHGLGRPQSTTFRPPVLPLNMEFLLINLYSKCHHSILNTCKLPLFCLLISNFKLPLDFKWLML